MRRSRFSIAVVLVQVVVGYSAAAAAEPSGPDYVAGKLIRMNDNGAWSWFMDERAIVHEGKLVVGSVRAVGTKYTPPAW